MRREDLTNISVTGEGLRTSEREYTAQQNQIGGVINAVEQRNDGEPGTHGIRNGTSSPSLRGAELYREFAEFAEATEEDILEGADVGRSFDHLRTAAQDTLAFYGAGLMDPIWEVLTVAEQSILSGLDTHDTNRLFDHVLTAIHGILMDYFVDEVNNRPAA